MSKRVSYFIIVGIVVYALINAEYISILATDFYHGAKYNERYISRTYNIEVLTQERSGKDRFFFGAENNTGKSVIVIVPFRRAAFSVYEDEGTSRESVISIIDKKGITVTSIDLFYYRAYDHLKDRRKKLYWWIEATYPNDRLMVRFIDGEVTDLR